MISRYGNKGFTLAEIMIIAAVIALIVVIAIPNLLRARVNVNEEAAQSTIKTIATACESYRAAQRIPSYDPAGPPEPTNMTNASVPYLDAGIFAVRGSHGYIFTYTPMATIGGITQQYVCGAEPVTLNVTGSKTFAINETGVLRSTPGKSTINTQELYYAMTVVQ